MSNNLIYESHNLLDNFADIYRSQSTGSFCISTDVDPGILEYRIRDYDKKKDIIKIVMLENNSIKYYINYFKNSDEIIVYESKYDVIEFKKKLLFIQSMYLSKYAYIYQFQYQLCKYIHPYYLFLKKYVTNTVIYFYPIFKNKNK
jgi:hypothetical protein